MYFSKLSSVSKCDFYNIKKQKNLISGFEKNKLWLYISQYPISKINPAVYTIVPQKINQKENKICRDIRSLLIYFMHFKCCSSVTKSCLTLVTPWTAACLASLSFTISWSLFKLLSIESVMPSNHIILCNPLLLLPVIIPSIARGDQSIGASTSTAILSMNIQI